MHHIPQLVFWLPQSDPQATSTPPVPSIILQNSYSPVSCKCVMKLETLPPLASFADKIEGISKDREMVDCD